MGYPSRETFESTVDNLLYGPEPIITDAAVIAEGEYVTPGMVLGKVTGTGQLKLSKTNAGDGSQTPYAIAWNEVDATEGARPAIVLLKGHVNSRALTVGEGHTVDGLKDALREKGIFVSEAADPSDPDTEDTGS